jgi:hypothetical protein
VQVTGVGDAARAEDHCRTLNLGIHGSELITEMDTIHKLDDVVTPDMTAKAWDAYLHRCGAGEYISARYGSPVREVTLSPREPPLCHEGSSGHRAPAMHAMSEEAPPPRSLFERLLLRSYEYHHRRLFWGVRLGWASHSSASASLCSRSAAGGHCRSWRWRHRTSLSAIASTRPQSQPRTWGPHTSDSRRHRG